MITVSIPDRENNGVVKGDMLGSKERKKEIKQWGRGHVYRSEGAAWVRRTCHGCMQGL